MISDSFLDKATAQRIGNETSLGDSLRNADAFIGSTLVDVGTTLFNSVVSIPKLFGVNTDEYKVETYDMLKSVNEDWAGYYSQSRDLVETASFVAGVLLPAGAAFKGMKLLQAGKLGYYPTALSDVTQAARTSELQQMLTLGQKATPEFRNLRWKILTASAGQEVAQAAGAELAVIATMNQHVWMEDYLKDPVTNFAIGLGLGGVIGTGIGQLQTRKMLRQKLGDIATESLDKVTSKLIDIPLGISDVDKMQRFSVNSSILRGIVEDETNSPLTRQIAEDFATRWEGMAGRLEQNSIFGPNMKASKDVDALKQARTVMLSDAAFGANRVDFLVYEPKEFTKQSARAGELLTGEARTTAEANVTEALWNAGKATRLALTASEGLKSFKPEWAKLMTKEFNTLYSPYHNAWIPASEVANYSRAVDTGLTTWEVTNVFKPNVDAFTEFAVREIPTATSDRYWLNTLGSVAAAKLEPKIYMMAGDLGVQNAWLSRFMQLESEGKQLPVIHLIPETAASSSVTEMKKSGVAIGLDDLERHLAGQKTAQIKQLLNAGASTQEIGIRLNIPSNVVERHLLEGRGLQEIGNWRAYTDAGTIASDYLSQSSRMLSFTTNGHRVASLAFRNADQSANLDAKAIRYANKELMADAIAGSDSTIARTYYETLNKDDKVWEIFEQQLSNIVNEKSGSFFFTSADFAARDMGDIGRIATQKGQEFFGVANSLSQELLTPVSTKLRTVIASQVGLNDFNRVINLLQSTSGYRDIDVTTGELFKRVEQEPGVTIKVPLRHLDGTAVALSDDMKAFLIELRNTSRELWKMKNTMNKIQGFKELNDIGLWIPSFNPINKYLSYVIDTQSAEGGSRVKLLMGRTPEELAGLEQRWKATNGTSDRYNLVTKAQQEDYNFWQMRQDPTEMDFADISKFHTGASGQALDLHDESFAATMIENLHNRVIFYGRRMQEMYLDDIMSTLDAMSAVNQKYSAGQPTLLKSVGLGQREDAARAIKNVLLGNNQLGNYSTWQSVNNGFGSMVEYGSRKVQEFYRGMFEYDEKARLLKKAEYVKYDEELKSIGVTNPFRDFNDYVTNTKVADNVLASAGEDKLKFAGQLEDLRVQALQRRLGTNYDSAERIIAAGNSILATTALRVLETGQAIVTAISWPILTLPEFYRKMPTTFLGNALGEGVNVAFPARAIYDGIRFRHSDMAKPLIERWIKEGYGASIVSEATKLNDLINTGSKSSIGKINEILQSDIIKKLSTPSDFMESETRLWVLSTGYQLARRMYPGITDTAADTFAKEFMTRSIGNYYSAQRPAMFQGTLGVAMGLFQTYMLSWAQSAFRSVEAGNMKALSAQLLTQNALFGMSSQPMYDLFSKTIGEHFSDKHYDLSSGTYRALPTHLAEFITYGLPASLGIGLYTRGDMQPRLPFTQDSPLDTIAAVNATRQVLGATSHTLQKVYEANGMSDKFRGLLEGISMQSVSRPMARIVETIPMPGPDGVRALGSVSREGNTISTSDQVWSVPGMLSRLVASRSAEEQIKREVDYLNTFYGSIDHNNRKRATEKLKTAIRGGNLDQETLDQTATTYLRTGTATGWNAALNEALATSEGGIDYKLGKRLRPDSPLQKMIKENF